MPATSWTSATPIATAWTPVVPTAVTYRQVSGEAYDEATRTYDAVEQTGAKRLYNGILSSNYPQGDLAHATTWT